MAKEIKPFDTVKKPSVPNPLLMPIEWGGTIGLTLPVGGKVTKVNCEGLEPPYILLSNHASFIDFALAVKANYPHRTSWLISIEEFVGREWLMRGIGGTYKRKFTSDLTVVRNLLHILKTQKRVCTIYPEARFSICGVNERLDPSLGKLAKVAKCPVAVMIERGSFLRSPQWCKHPYRDVPVSAEMTQIVTREEVLTLSAEEIQERIENAFYYDEYRWQYENRIVIDSPKRAQGLHRVLYQCPHCGTEFRMNSEGTKLFCEACGSIWEMDVYGQLRCENGEDIFPMVPDWYRWERENVRREVEEGRYRFEDDVRVEFLQNAKQGFKAIGTMKLTHDENGFVLEGKKDGGEGFRLHRTTLSMYSCHIEYDFKGRGDALELATLNETYFVFPLNAQNVLTKFHFATEELHDKFVREEEAKKAAEKAEKAEGQPEENGTLSVRDTMILKKKNEIVTERLVLKFFSEDDRDRLTEFMMNEQITKYFMVPSYDTKEQYSELAGKLIEFSKPEDGKHLEYGIYLDGTLIGFVNDCGFDDEAIEIGYVIHPDYWNRGYATEAVKAVIGALWEMGFRRVIAGFFEENTGSFRVMEKCGMKLNGEYDYEEYRGVRRKCLYCEINKS